MAELAQVSFDAVDGVTVARLAGEIDISNAAAVGERLSGAAPSDAAGLVVDLEPLSFLDSSGVSMLFALARRLSGRRLKLRVAIPRVSPVRRVLELVDFARAAPVDDSVEQAVASLREEAPERA